MKEDQPKISIIITCYNYQEFVGIAIESALAQTYKNIEIIVVDDGSTDNSPVVINKYGNNILSIRQENKGHIAAYNRGYEVSNSDIVIFLDADDLLCATATEEVAAAWNRSCVKVQYDLDIIDGNGQSLGRRFCNFKSDYSSARIRKSFLRHGTYRWPVTTGNAYSRWFLEIVMPLIETDAPDGMLNTIAPVYGEILTICRPLASYRLHGKNLWASNGRDLLRLPERINGRRNEISIMVKHAKMNNQSLPAGNILDHELPFINYRLMAFKLGQNYDTMKGDTLFRLWWNGTKLLIEERLPFHISVGNFIWLSTLTLAPRNLATILISFRYNRARYLQPVRKLIKGGMSGIRGSARWL